MGRPPCCDKLNVKRGLWTEDEDTKILAYVAKHGPGNWSAMPKKAGLKRCGKSCRLRWTNYLRPDLRHESFTQEEEQMIIQLHATIGSRGKYKRIVEEDYLWKKFLMCTTRNVEIDYETLADATKT